MKATNAITVSKVSDADVTVDKLKLKKILTSQYPYSQRLVTRVDLDGGVEIVNYPSSYLNTAHSRDLTYAVGGLEYLNKKIHDVVRKVASGIMHHGPVSASCIIARKGGPVFPQSQDTNGVYFRVISGVKLVKVNGVDYWLREGNTIMIGQGATYIEQNREDSIVLKIEFHQYMEDLLR